MKTPPVEEAVLVTILDAALPKASEKDHSTNIKDLILDAGTQPRVNLNQEIIENYTEIIKEAGKSESPIPLPNVSVARLPDGRLLLFDGFHRTRAHKAAGVKSVVADIYEAKSVEQATLWSLAVNAEHGLYRSNRDKQRAVRQAFELLPAETPNTEIARITNTSESFVRTNRPAAKSSPVRTVSRGGKKMTQSTSRTKKPKAEKKSKAKKSKASKAAPANSDGAKPDKLSIMLGKICDGIGGSEGEKVVKAISDGSLDLSSRDVMDWAGFTKDTQKAIAPLVVHHKMKPHKAYEFTKSEPSAKCIEDLHLRAIAAGGTYEFKTDSVKIVVTHTGKK